jgi:hypothetical protein
MSLTFVQYAAMLHPLYIAFATHTTLHVSRQVIRSGKSAGLVDVFMVRGTELNCVPSSGIYSRKTQ